MSTSASIEKRMSTGDQPEQTRGGRTYIPAVDIVEKGDELLLLADVPGAKAEGIAINYERGALTVAARVAPRQNAPTNVVLREYGVGDFLRTFQIGEGIDASKINAELSNGVLTVHLPKSEAARTRKIAVKSN